MTTPEDAIAPTVQATLRTIADVPVSEHPEIFEAIHAELQAALATLDEL
jgi:hypothetical protein